MTRPWAPATAGATRACFSCRPRASRVPSLVGFFSRRQEYEHHVRSAVLTYSDDTGCFPPNTLFRLKEVKEPGTWEAPGGFFPQQRLLVVTATYLVPSKAQEFRGNKLCASSSALSYGDRSTHTRGLDDLVGRPVLSMAQECARSLSWKDWKGA